MPRLLAPSAVRRLARLAHALVYLSLALVFTTASPIFANGPTVTNLNDSGPGSLRQALVDAAPGDTISISVSGVLTLSSELVVGKAVAIVGPGAASLTVSGGGASRGFRVVTTGVTIQGLTVTGGAADNGGGIVVEPTASLALSQCAVTGNRTNGLLTTGGGGIYNAGSLSITDCVVSQNLAAQALGGGGIANTGALTLTRATIAANQALDGVGGGGVYNLGTLTSHDTIVTGNTASGAVGGGGLFNAGSLDATTLTVTGNTSSGLVGGGGLANWAKPFPIVTTLRDSVIRGNTATQGHGGGILNVGAAANATASLSLETSTISDNSAPDGAGIANRGLEGAASLSMSRSTLAGNTATSGGGVSNTATGAAASITIDTSTISGNTATTGAGGLVNTASGAAASLTLRGATVAANTGNQASALTSRGSAATIRYRNTILAGVSPVSASVDGGALISDGHNLSTDATGNLTASGDRPATDPHLAPLANYGGPTLTHALLAGSPAIDAGDNQAVSATDQRGFSRIVDGNRDGVAVVDIGAYEFPDNAVTNLNDSGLGSLRQAILDANSGAAGASIRFDIPVGGTHIYTIDLASPLPPLATSVTIDGSSQPGFAGEPLIELNGAGAGAAVAGLRLDGGHNSLRGLRLTGFSGPGVLVTSDGNVLNGVTSMGNGGDGVRIQAASNTTIQGSVIADNGGAGIAILSGTGNSILGNRITGNGGLGIDLGGDGVTPNGGAGGGPNNGQPYPVINVATARQSQSPLTELQASIQAAPNSTYRVELYDNATCDASGYGQGQALVVSRTVTTDADGQGVFVVTQSDALPLGHTISATATDANGNTSEFSRCQSVVKSNDTWANAAPLDLTNLSSGIYGVTVQRFVVEHDQAKWFRFSAPPNSRVIINVAGHNGALPVNYDVSLHKDVSAVYSQLTRPQDLDLLTAEAAPDQFLPDQFLPDQFLPDQFLPDQFLPDQFLPDQFLPDQFLPDQFLPDQFLPDQFLPDQFLPDQFLPDQFLPDQFLPDQFLRAAYTGALKRSLLAVSARPGTTPELITRNSLDQPGDRYLRVFGRGGVFSQAEPFEVRVFVITGACADVNTIDPSIPANLAPNEPATYKTLIVTDSSRVPGSAAEKATLRAQLTTLAARPEVSGVIMDLGETLGDGTSRYKRVAAAKTQADARKECPYSKNILASEIRAILDSYRAIHPVQYLVIAGSDDVVPYFRTPDLAGLGAESEYIPPVDDNSALQASLKNDQVLSQEPYGSLVSLNRGDHVFPIPGLAIGRLVETAPEMTAMIDAYSAANGFLRPQAALVTGYDFVTDAAQAVKGELEAGLSAVGCQEAGNCVSASQLIMPADMRPSDPRAWTADDLRAQLLGQRHDLVFLAGHFSAGAAVAGDDRTRVLASELVAAPLDLSNTLIYSIGCHSGFNIPTGDAIPGVSPDPDWPQAFARKGITSIVGTGFQYGDTEVIEYAERLHLNFTRLLRTGNEPVAIGVALLQAKQKYLAETAQLRGMHEKTILQTALFGLPMLRIDMPGQRLQPAVETSIVSGASPVVTGPGALFGLAVGLSAEAPGSEVITVRSTLRRVSVTLRGENNTSVVTQYFVGSNGVVANPLEPLLPLELRLADVPGKTLRGVIWLGGQYTDEGDFVPLTSSPTTELDRGRVQFGSSVFYPGLPWAVNYLDELDERKTRLAVVPAQYKSGPADPATGQLPSSGTLRRYGELSFRLFYSNWTGLEAVAQAPRVDDVTASQGPSGGTVRARVFDQSSVGIQEVWLTYTEGCSGILCTSEWKSIPMQPSGTDATLWEMPTGVTIPNSSRFIIQAVNSVGVVGRGTNQGAYFAVSDAPPPPDDRRIWYIPMLVKGIDLRTWRP